MYPVGQGQNNAFGIKCNRLLIKLVVVSVAFIIKKTTNEFQNDNFSINVSDEHINIIAPNHRSYFDAFLICCMTFKSTGIWPIVIASKHFKENRVFSFFTDYMNTLYLDRTLISSKTLKQIKSVSKGSVVLFFPEGRRVIGDEIVPPTLKLLRKFEHNALITPIHIEYEKLPEQRLLKKESVQNYKTPLNKLTIIFFIWFGKACLSKIDIGRLSVCSVLESKFDDSYSEECWIDELSNLEAKNRQLNKDLLDAEVFDYKNNRASKFGANIFSILRNK